jgi:hypothetical protein
MQVVLNEAQRGAVSWYFDPDNEDGEPWPLDEPVEIEVVGEELTLNGVFLHPDGEWGTMPWRESGSYKAQQETT